MATSDEIIVRIGADVSGVVAGMAEASSSVETASKKMASAALQNANAQTALSDTIKEFSALPRISATEIEFLAQREVEAMAASDALKSSKAELAAAMEVTTVEASQESIAVEELNTAVVANAAASDVAAGSQKNFGSAMGAARVEMGALEGSAGMMAGGLARVAAQSAFLAPLITAAFPIFAAFALVDILVHVYEAFQKVTNAVEGYTEAVQGAEKEDIKFSDAALSHVDSLTEAQQRLHDVIAEQGRIAQESYGDKYSGALRRASDETSNLWGPLQALVVEYRALAHAESDAADEQVRLTTAQRAITAEMPKLTIETDRAALKLIELKEAADAAGKESGPSGRVQNIRAEIAALNDKQRVEEDIAAKEAATKGGTPTDQSQARTVVAEEYYLKRIALTKNLSEAETTAAEEARKKTEEQYVEAIKLASKYKESVEAIHALETEPLKITVDDSGLKKLTPFTDTEARTMVATYGAAALKMAQETSSVVSEETAFWITEEDKRLAKTREVTDKEIVEKRKYLDEIAKESETSSLAEIKMQETTAADATRIAQAKVGLSIGTAEEKTRQTITTERQELESLKTFEDQKLQVEIDYQNRLKEVLLAGRSIEQFSAPGGSTTEEVDEFRAINAEIEALQQAHAQKMEQINSQITLNAIKDDQQIATEAQRAANVIGQSFDSAFSEILQRHQTFSATMQHFWNDMVAGWARMGLQIVGTYVQHLAQIALQEILTEAKITTVHTGAMSARQATDNMHASFLQLLGIKQVTQTATAEAAKTSVVVASNAKDTSVVAASQTAQAGAVAVGQAAQTGAATAGASVRQSIGIVEDIKSVGRAAAVAAAHAFKWVMEEVPFPVNAVLAPVAAAVAFTSVLAFGKFEKGGVVHEDMIAHVHAGEVVIPAAAAKSAESTTKFLAPVIPGFVAGGVVSEDMIAQVHKNEMVLPANISTPLQAALKPQAAPSAATASPFGPLQIMVPDISTHSPIGSLGLPGAAGAAGSAGVGTGGQSGAPGLPGAAGAAGSDTHTHHNYFRFEVNNHGSDNSKMTVDSVAKLMKQAQRMGKV